MKVNTVGDSRGEPDRTACEVCLRFKALLWQINFVLVTLVAHRCIGLLRLEIPGHPSPEKERNLKITLPII